MQFDNKAISSGKLNQNKWAEFALPIRMHKWPAYSSIRKFMSLLPNS